MKSNAINDYEDYLKQPQGKVQQYINEQENKVQEYMDNSKMTYMQKEKNIMGMRLDPEKCGDYDMNIKDYKSAIVHYSDAILVSNNTVPCLSIFKGDIYQAARFRDNDYSSHPTVNLSLYAKLAHAHFALGNYQEVIKCTQYTLGLNFKGDLEYEALVTNEKKALDDEWTKKLRENGVYNVKGGFSKELYELTKSTSEELLNKISIARDKWYQVTAAPRGHLEPKEEANLHVLLGQSYGKLGDIGKAKEHFTDAIGIASKEEVEETYCKLESYNSVNSRKYDIEKFFDLLGKANLPIFSEHNEEKIKEEIIVIGNVNNNPILLPEEKIVVLGDNNDIQ